MKWPRQMIFIFAISSGVSSDIQDDGEVEEEEEESAGGS